MIRLHGPWEGTQCGRRNAECGIDDAQDRLGASDVSKPDRVKVPLNFGDWLEPDFRGTVVLERAFGLPTNLDEQQAVHLVLQTEHLPLGSVSINGTMLPTSAVADVSDSSDDSNKASLHRHEITSFLQARNRLRLTLAVDSEPSGRLISAAIEIRGC